MSQAPDPFNILPTKSSDKADISCAAPMFAWLTRMRLQFIRWRTVRLMEQIDADTGSALWFRDIEIPDLLTRLAQDKYALLDQLDQVTSELDALANR